MSQILLTHGSLSQLLQVDIVGEGPKDQLQLQTIIEGLRGPVVETDLVLLDTS